MGYKFPVDANGKAGAVRPTADGNNFFIPTVMYGADGVTVISSTNPFPTSLSTCNVEQVILATNSLVTGPQSPQPTNSMRTLVVEVYGTASSFNIEIQGRLDSTTYYPLTGVNLNGLSSVQSITSFGLYKFDVTGLVNVLGYINEVSGGNINIIGNLVA
ncbi:hypothetical protein [Alicyclobacillus acidoterrestris]|uniref:Uncharacterized protein n=1 Tax=Alicyclobacillus acidoterrestris (strain ATCC 49025 / DSM 3922 / CIP 106132 / NCIMB 13137 / GD3B) TaxID=1356854 RepID=T0D803_ALIAG|nr:hypothetical protein [Alicyclobacillus acidoterrestris]EPZ47622.1 hypothetical protein N007_05030 [Alicyclobacillus acidoterrestris ATCC 49025]UNO48058.1 hypothetical protein K1I37_15400 [Alicyclobacillus acidoterrestris]